MSNLKIFCFDRTPKGVGKVCLKFPSQCRQASFPDSAVCIAFGVLPKTFFGGCSQRLTLKDFTTMSWIRDILLLKLYASQHRGAMHGVLR